MAYQFQYTVHQNLAKLGWGMIITPQNPIVDVHIGTMVEAKEDFFVSGVWDGDFSAGDFHTAEYFCGCGVKRTGDKLVAYTATHERQRICCAEKDGKIYITNSVPFLLALTGDKLDIDCDQYEKILCSVIEGLEDYQKKIPLADGRAMYQLFAGDLTIDKDGNASFARKELHRDFTDYQDYYSAMVNVCKKIRDNGADPARKHAYGMIATTSSGYDSSSCAAVVREVGCEIACTFCEGKYDKDSGADIARQLGYPNILQRSCYDYKKRADLLDATFFADGDLGFFMPFAGFEDAFVGNIVVNGISGSYTWNRDSKVNADSKREGYYFYTANLSFNEHAIQEGYMVLPLVLYGSTAVVSIQKISNSKEMEPWMMNNNYDRPIPRRILETKGVTRESFGQVNRGAGISFSRNFSTRQIRQKMTPAGYRAFMKWLKTKGNNRWSFQRMIHNLQYHLSTIPEYLDFVASKLNWEPNFSKNHPNLYPNTGLPAKMVIWGIETTVKKYTSALME